MSPGAWFKCKVSVHSSCVIMQEQNCGEERIRGTSRRRQLRHLKSFSEEKAMLLNPGPAAHCSKANKEARLVERKVCFILDAGNWAAGRVDGCPKADSPHPRQSVGKSFYRQREGPTCRNNAVSSDSHLEIGHRLSDQRHLDCFRYS